MSNWYDRAKGKMRELNVTQDHLIRVFDVKTRGAVGHYLTGRREPPVHTVVSLADHLGMSLDELLRDKPVPQSQLSGLDPEKLRTALRIMEAAGTPFTMTSILTAIDAVMGVRASSAEVKKFEDREKEAANVDDRRGSGQLGGASSGKNGGRKKGAA